MSEPLTAADLCEVAKAVTGEHYHHAGGSVYNWQNPKHGNCWAPDFNGYPVFRSQALAVVEYVCAHHMNTIECRDICEAVWHKDINELMRMALKIHKEQTP